MRIERAGGAGFARRALVDALLRPFWPGEQDLVAIGGGGVDMDERLIVKRLELLRTEHRDLDSAIDALRDQNSSDQLQIARLKKRKLRLRDEIALLEDELIPDIIA